MAYEYDVFLSYCRDTLFGKWVDEMFYPQFEPHLTAALGRKAEIFRDTANISPADAFPQRIRKALAHSRYLVAVLSPQYFLSGWCKYEFGTMHYRATELGHITEEKPNALILPINIRDGKHFPKAAIRINYFDCRGYLRAKASFEKTETYSKYQGKVIEWADRIAGLIEKPPQWRRKWSSDKWHKAAIKHSNKIFPDDGGCGFEPPLLD